MSSNEVQKLPFPLKSRHSHNICQNNHNMSSSYSSALTFFLSRLVVCLILHFLCPDFFSSTLGASSFPVFTFTFSSTPRLGLVCLPFSILISHPLLYVPLFLLPCLSLSLPSLVLEQTLWTLLRRQDQQMFTLLSAVTNCSLQRITQSTGTLRMSAE